MARTPRKRHFRYGRFDRQRRSKHYKAFLSAKAGQLDGYSTEITFTAVDSAQASQEFEASSNFDPAESVTIGDTVYVFTNDVEVYDDAYNVQIGANADESIANLAAAINGTAGPDVAGPGTEPHPSVTAEAAYAVLTVTAIAVGAAGNSILTDTDAYAAAWDYGTLQGGADASDVLSATSHGLAIGDGPYQLITSGDLPPGFSTDVLYWVATVPDANTFTLSAKRVGAITPPLDAGSGTHEMHKGDNEAAVHEYLKQNPPEVVRDADDADDLLY